MISIQSEPKLNTKIELGKYLVEHAREIVADITLIPMPATAPTIESLLKFMQANKITDLILLDQQVAGIETSGKLTPYGFEYTQKDLRITVIDHHVKNQTLSGQATSNLVPKYLEAHPEGPGKDTKIIITHGDCDSLISVLMIKKHIPTDSQFREAAMVADHETDQINPIADLLQAIESTPKAGETVRRFQPTEEERFNHNPLAEYQTSLQFMPSLELSTRNLGLLLQNQPLDLDVQTRVNARTEARAQWDRRINSKEFIKLEHGTFYFIIPETLETDPCPEFLKSKLPDAKIILVFHKSPEDQDFNQIRVVRGAAAPNDLVLTENRIITDEIVPGYGGREEGGSNRRGGHSLQADPRFVAEQIDANLSKQL